MQKNTKKCFIYICSLFIWHTHDTSKLVKYCITYLLQLYCTTQYDVIVDSAVFAEFLFSG